MKRKILTYGSLVALLLAALSGILLTVTTYQQIRRNIYEDHDLHLMDLANTVDNNVSNLIDRCFVELEAMTEDPWIQMAEETLHQTGDSEKLRYELQNCFLLRTDLVNRVLVLKNGKTLLCSECDGDCGFRLLPGEGTDQVGICTDGSETYITFSLPSQDGKLTYVLLVYPELLFERAVSSTIYNDYWITIVDMASGFAMQNGTDQTKTITIPPDEMAQREDGYSIILRQCDARESGFDSYRYIYNDGRDTIQRMATIPDNCSANKSFSIGVTVNSSHIAVPTRQATIRIMVCAAVIVYCLGAFFFWIFRGNRNKKLLTRKLEILEAEKNTAAEVLEQQTRLAHNQRLEYVGLLTSSVSHEFNNLLTPIMGYSMLLLDNLSPEEAETYDSVLEIYNASLRAKDLVERLSNYSRKQGTRQVRKIPVSQLMNDTLTIAAPVQPKNVEVLKELLCDGSIECEETQLIQMLLNLVVNGFQAMTPQGGTLTVSTETQDGSAVFRIHDTGVGIAAENMEKIFDPFYTSKGNGTGLGLPIVRQIVEDYGGTISVLSDKEHGTIFTVTIPIR